MSTNSRRNVSAHSTRWTHTRMTVHATRTEPCSTEIHGDDDYTARQLSCRIRKSDAPFPEPALTWTSSTNSRTVEGKRFHSITSAPTTASRRYVTGITTTDEPLHHLAQRRVECPIQVHSPLKPSIRAVCLSHLDNCILTDEQTRTRRVFRRQIKPHC